MVTSENSNFSKTGKERINLFPFSNYLTESPGRGFEAASPQILRGEGLPRFFPSPDPTHVGASGTGFAPFFIRHFEQCRITSVISTSVTSLGPIKTNIAHYSFLVGICHYDTINCSAIEAKDALAPLNTAIWLSREIFYHHLSFLRYSLF